MEPGAVHLGIDLQRFRWGQPRPRSRPDIGEDKVWQDYNLRILPNRSSFNPFSLTPCKTAVPLTLASGITPPLSSPPTAAAHKPPRSPTAGAVKPPVCALPPPPPASWPSFSLSPRSAVPISSGPCPARAGSVCTERTAPAASLSTRP